MAKPAATNEFDEIKQLLSKDGSVHVTDELINTATSIVGACFALLGTALLVSQAAVQARPWSIVGFTIYGLTLINLFISSTLHHGLNGSVKTNQHLRTYDYVSIFTLIAGTITPLVLIRARNPFGWSVFGVVWVIAVIGVLLRTRWPQLPQYITSTLYIVLGWLAGIVVAAHLHLQLGGLLLLAAGGLIYSSGFVLFVTEKPNIKPGFFGFHELWHCLVIAAAACQFCALYFYVLNP